MFCCKSLETRKGSPLTNRPSHIISLKLSVCLLINTFLICSHNFYPCKLMMVGYSFDVTALEDFIGFIHIIYPLLVYRKIFVTQYAFWKILDQHIIPIFGQIDIFIITHYSTRACQL